MVVDWRAPVSRAVLPGQPDRADGRRAAPPVRLPARRADRLRGRGPGRAATVEEHWRSSRRRSSGPASARCATSSPPSSPSRTSSSAPTCRTSDLRAGRPRDRQDRGRPAPRGVPALCASRPAQPPGRAGGRAERQLPALHRRRAAGARRDRRAADHDRGAAPRPWPRCSRRRDPRRDSAAVATLKGDARMAAVLHRALWSQVRRPTEALVVPRGSRRWRVAAYEAEEVVAELRSRGVRYGAGAGDVAAALAHADPGEDGAGR